MSKKILFFGNERLATGVTTAAPALSGLVEAGFEVAALVVAQAESGQSRQPRQLEVAAVAEQHHIPLLVIDDLVNAQDQLKSFGAEAAVLVAYGKLVPQAVIEVFPHGIINIHPSLLPQYRGSTPLESVILDGASETGVSLMSLASEMDAGPVFAQQNVPLSGHETKQELAGKLAEIGAEMVLQNLPKILDGSLSAQPQTGKPTFCKQIEKQDGVLDFAKPAVRLEREVRAYAGWPRSRTTIGKTDVIVTQTRIMSGQGTAGNLWRDGQQLGVYTSGGILVIDQLIPAGKKEMPIAAFLAGYSI